VLCIENIEIKWICQ